MKHLVWAKRPELHRPALVAAFEGWNDAGDAATTAARWLADQWGTEPFATIDPEEFFDFSSSRPHVRLDDHGQREIIWPTNQLLGGRVPGTGTDVIFLIGTEPQLRWRTFCAAVLAVADQYDVSLVVSLGALLAEVPHTRPVSVVGTAPDRELGQRLGMTVSRYEGPTGIIGALTDACHRAGRRCASLWAAVPTYVPSATSPKAALALVERCAGLLELPVVATELEIASAAYERQLDELVAEDDETAAYVARLVERSD
ncbi:MAG: PAC2 family protein, partial [Acidimicrobiales bacterium]